MEHAQFYRVQWIDPKGKAFYIGVGRMGGYVRHTPITRSKWNRKDAIWLKEEGEMLGYRCLIIPIPNK